MARVVAQVISFEQHAVARLREKLGAAVETNEDLIAFARGHWGAVSSINSAVLSIIDVRSVEELLDVITREWPAILGIDFVAVALRVCECGFRADGNGVERVEARFVDRMVLPTGFVELGSVGRGHALFGLPASRQVRAQALIRIDSVEPLPRGLLALGQRDRLEVESAHGSELLCYLGQVIGATVRRVTAPH